MAVDADEEVGREERTLRFDALSILPDSLNLVGWEERFDLADIEHTAHGLLVLGHCVESKPGGDVFGGDCVGRLKNHWVGVQWDLRASQHSRT